MAALQALHLRPAVVTPPKCLLSIHRLDLSLQPTYGGKLPPYHDLDVVRELARLQHAANLAALQTLPMPPHANSPKHA